MREQVSTFYTHTLLLLFGGAVVVGGVLEVKSCLEVARKWRKKKTRRASCWQVFSFSATAAADENAGGNWIFGLLLRGSRRKISCEKCQNSPLCSPVLLRERKKIWVMCWITFKKMKRQIHREKEKEEEKILFFCKLKSCLIGLALLSICK